VNTLRLLLDQMIDVEVAEELRRHGYDVVRVSEVGMAAADDSEILSRAINDARILVTLDGHFGDWAVLPLETHPGVIRIRVSPTTSSAIIALLLPFLTKHGDRKYANQLVIVRPSGVRWVRTGT
jgi:predicted nuclease of predicted toxin-antitoxin system